MDVSSGNLMIDYLEKLFNNHFKTKQNEKMTYSFGCLQPRYDRECATSGY